MMRRLALAALAAAWLAHPAAAQTRDTPVGPVTIEEVAAPPETGEGKKAYAAHMRQVRKVGVFGAYLAELDPPARALACGRIAEALVEGAANAPDPAERIARLGPAWRLTRRVAPARDAALASLSKEDLAGFEREFGEVMTMASLIPDPAITRENLDTSEAGFAFQFASVHAARCHQRLDADGVPDVTGPPTPAFIDEHTRFRFRGMDYAAAFASTGLAPFADTICRGRTTFDFAGAPLGERGYEGMSLLDWAMACEDRAAFDALIAAGFDLDAPGLWGDPPVVGSASEKRLWYLTRLLDAGARVDAAGPRETALVAASSDLDAINSGGDPMAAFNLLRARGASLDFPDFGGSMWYRWGLHGQDGGWATILAHWDEFASDPVELAGLAEAVLEGRLAWMKGQQADAAKVKALLIERYGVCFPVGQTFAMARDERGFVIQPDCPSRR